MAHSNQSQHEENIAINVSKQLPIVVVLGPPHFLKYYEQEFTAKFQVLRAWDSPIPLDQFLDTYAGSVQAMLCSGTTSVIADVIRRLPSLRLIVTSSAGVNHIDLSECRRRGISVAGAGTLFSEDVADMAVGLLLDVLRKITAADGFVRRGLWLVRGVYPLGSKLGGKRVGIVGLGSIGLEVAKRLEAFGCIISYHSRKKKPFVLYPFYSSACELALNSDILVICCALNDQTHHLINKEALSALGKDGVIVNIARGAVIDEKELIECLLHGEIAGAGLDVFENEPCVPEELCKMENVVMSPHCAVYANESYQVLFELLTGNLEAFFSNKPLLSPVVEE